MTECHCHRFNTKANSILINLECLLSNLQQLPFDGMCQDFFDFYFDLMKIIQKGNHNKITNDRKCTIKENFHNDRNHRNKPLITDYLVTCYI